MPAFNKRPSVLANDPFTAEKIAPAFYCHAPNGTGVTSAEYVAKVRRIRLTLTAVAITTTDETTAGAHGALKVIDFNAGLVAIVGAETNLAITAAAGLSATAAIVGALGSTAADNANGTLTSTEADILPSTTCTLSSSAGVFDGEFTAVSVFNGTATPTDVYLNFAVPDAGTTANSTITVTGYIDLYVIFLGDND